MAVNAYYSFNENAPMAIDADWQELYQKGLQGKMIKTLVNNKVTSGNHSITIDRLSEGSYQGTGLYLCKMEAHGLNRTIDFFQVK